MQSAGRRGRGAVRGRLLRMVHGWSTPGLWLDAQGVRGLRPALDTHQGTGLVVCPAWAGSGWLDTRRWEFLKGEAQSCGRGGHVMSCGQGSEAIPVTKPLTQSLGSFQPACVRL